MEHRTVLGDVDALARKHRRAPGGEPGLPEEGEEVAHRRGIDALLAEVEVQVVRLGGHRLCAAGLAGEQLAQVDVAEARGVRQERPVCGQRVERSGRVHGGA